MSPWLKRSGVHVFSTHEGIPSEALGFRCSDSSAQAVSYSVQITGQLKA